MYLRNLTSSVYYVCRCVVLTILLIYDVMYEYFCTTCMSVYFSQISTLWPLMTERANISSQEMQREG